LMVSDQISNFTGVGMLVCQRRPRVAARPGDLGAVEAAAALPFRPARFQAAGQLRIARRDDERLAARVREIVRATCVPLRRGS
jgi:hypothetical protein